jgi:hypothetical protein
VKFQRLQFNRSTDADTVFSMASSRPDPDAAARFDEPAPENRASLTGPLIVYAVLFAVLLPFYWYALTPDTVSYISIAREYAHGHWAEAVNTYWSPAFSWLIAAFLALRIPEPLAFHLASGLGGIAMLLAVARTARLFRLSRRLTLAVLYTSAIVCLNFVLLQPGPDLLLAAIVLAYFVLVISPDATTRTSQAGQCGLLGAAAFLTKAFGFYFFLAHFALMAAFYAVRERGRRRAVLAWSATGFAVFAVASAPWIVAVSRKTGALSLGSTGGWNYRLVGPQSTGYPQYFRLFPPASPHAVSMWDEPHAFQPRWSPIASAANLRHELALIVSNVKSYAGFLMVASALSFAILLSYLVWGLARGSGTPWPHVLLLFLLFPGPYILVSIQSRYIWILTFLLLLMAAVPIQDLEAVLSPAARWILVAGVAASFLLMPAAGLALQRNAGRGLHRIAANLAKVYGVHGRIASCGDWNDSLEIAYFDGDSYYGSTAPTADEAGFSRELNPELRRRATIPPLPDIPPAAAQLRQYRIDYYLDWAACPFLDPRIGALPEITGGGIPGLKVYRATGSLAPSAGDGR